MKDIDKSKSQLIAELNQFKQNFRKTETKTNLLNCESLIDKTKDSISLIDKNYLYFDVNKTYLKAHNLKREEVVGRFVKDIFGEKIFINSIKNNVDKCLNGETVKYQKWFDFPKNIRRYMDVAFYPFYDENNIILGVMVSSHDITELKKSEEQLMSKELKYKILLHNIPGMVYTSTANWAKEVVNGAEKISEYSDNELLTGKIKWIDIIHPDDKDKTLLEVEELLKKAQTIICVYRIITKKGKIRWVEDRMTSSFYKPENEFRVDGIILDISKQKKADKVLKESEEYYKSLIENSSDVISILDKNGIICYESPSHQKILGYKKGYLIGKSAFEFVHPNDIEQISMQFAKLMATTNGTEKVNFRFRHKNGLWINIEGTGQNLLNLASVKGIVVNYRDVTKRRTTELALKKSEEKYRGIINSMTDIYYKTDGKGTLLMVNPAGITTLGYSSEIEILSADLKNEIYVNQDDRVKFKKEISDTGTVHNFRTTLYHKDKSYIYLEVNAKNIFDEKGNYAGVEGIARNISERVKNEEKILEQNIELKELNATKDKFFAIVAHDLRGPFNTMLGFSQLLINNFEKYDTQKQIQILGVLNQDIKNTYKLLENLLEWSSSQQETIDFKPQKENLYLLIAETIDILSKTAINKSINIKNEVPESIIVKADENMLSTIIRNLISNAIKFTPKGGTVEIGCSPILVKTHGRASQQAKNSLASLHEIYVKDNGVGISKEKQEKIFDITENTSTKGTNNEEGTGLGLILCKEFVEKHGGKIKIESETNKGSKFIFTLPMH